MNDENADLLRRVRAQIRNQRRNLNPGYSTEDHADRFHKELDRLQQAGYDVEEFRLDPERDMYLRVVSTNPRSGAKYAEKRDVHFGVLESQMDALLEYFEEDENQTPIKLNRPFLR